MLDYDMWVEKTAEELIWGYHETLFEYARLTMPNPPPEDKFGYFLQPNRTQDLARYTMHTGQGNPYKLSKISLINGQDSLRKWGANPQADVNKCNRVQGSDGSTFNPFIKQEDTLWFFNDQLC